MRISFFCWTVVASVVFSLFSNIPTATAAHVEFNNILGTDLKYVPMTPTRVLDTRISKPRVRTDTDIWSNRTGPEYAPGHFESGETLEVDLTPPRPVDGSKPGHQTAANGVVAVVINVTVTDVLEPGYLTLYPEGTSTRPIASNLNYAPGQTVANQVIVPTNPDTYHTATSWPYAFLYAHGKAHVIIDMVGIMSTKTDFKPMTPTRFVDTRNGYNGHTGPVKEKTEFEVEILGQHGIPQENVTSVVMNVTAVKPAGPGFFNVFPSGASRPLSSHLNYVADEIRAVMVTSALGANGNITVHSHGESDLVVDVLGYYTGTNDYVALTPQRFIDTREGLGAKKALVGARQEINLDIQNLGIPNTEEINSVALSVTATNGEKNGFVTVYPDGTDRPIASSLNYPKKHPVANSVLAKVGSNGKINFFTNENVDIIVDVVGYTRQPPPLKASKLFVTPQFRCAELTTGQVKCWGYHTGTGERLLPVLVEGLTGITFLKENRPYHPNGTPSRCFSTESREIFCLKDYDINKLHTGNYSAERLPGITDAAGPIAYEHYLSLDGKLKSIKKGTSDPEPILTNVRSVTSDIRTTCAVLNSGLIKCFGDNRNNLGHGPDVREAVVEVPVTVHGITNAIKVVGSNYSFCALTEDKDVWCWGEQLAGYFKDGEAIRFPVETLLPYKIPDLGKVISLEDIGTGRCVVNEQGIKKCWKVDGQLHPFEGYNQYVGVHFNDVQPIQDTRVFLGFPDTGCALYNDDTVGCIFMPGNGTRGDGTKILKTIL